MSTWIIAAAALVSISAFLVHEIYSLDVWWQVAIGRDILETGSIPTIDRYSTAGMGQPYHDSHWLFQVLLGLANSAWGMIGVQWTMIALWTAVLALCYLSARRFLSATPAWILVFLVAMSSVERFLVRPELITFLGLAGFNLLLETGAVRRWRGVFLLALLQVVWTNGHGLFVLGPFLVACHWTMAGWARVRKRKSEFGPLSRALLVVLGATFVAPFGLRGWGYALLLFQEIGPQGPETLQRLGELSSAFEAWSSPVPWFYLLLILCGLAAAIRLVVARRIPPRLLVAAGLLAASLTGRRNVALFAIAAVPLIAEGWSTLIRPRRAVSRALVTLAILLMIGWSWYPLSGRFYIKMEIPARWGFGTTPSFFPHALPRFLDRIGFEGPVLNSNTLGGFYLFHGYPRRLPLTDGRWEIYDTDTLRQVMAGSRSSAGWRSVVSEYGIEGLLLAHTSPEAAAILPTLSRVGDWRLVYLDAAASFWLPADHPAASVPIDPDDPGALPEVRRPDDGLILHAFLASTGAHRALVASLERTLTFGVREELLLQQLGSIQLGMGQLVEARATFEDLLTRKPNNAVALNELAYLAYRRGEINDALRLLERLLRIAPDDPRYRENYERIKQQGSP